MNFEEKCHFAILELENAKIWKSNYNPPLVKLLHKLGCKVPLPHYNSFINNVLFTGSFFSFFWGWIMHFFVWRTQNISLIEIISIVIFAGASFGLALATYYKYGFKKHKLTPWKQIGNAKLFG